MEQRPKLSAPPWPPVNWHSLRPKIKQVAFADNYSAPADPEAGAPAMARVVQQMRMVSVEQVRNLTERSESVADLLFEKSLKDEHLSRDEFDSKMARGKSNSSLLALQAWSAEHHFSEADRMTLAAHFVQQALDRNDVCHVRSPLTPQPELVQPLAPPRLASPALGVQCTVVHRALVHWLCARWHRCVGTLWGPSARTICTRAAPGGWWSCWAHWLCTCWCSSNRKAPPGRCAHHHRHLGD